MGPRVGLLVLLGAGAGMLAFQIRAKPRPDPESVSAQARAFADPAAWKDRIAPDFELTLLDGAHVKLANEVGRRVVILNFFATWCGPCRAEMPELERFHQEHHDGVLLLGVDAEEKHTVVEEFIRNVRVTFPIGIDGTGDIGKAYDVSAYPTTVVVGADGRVKAYESGAISNADVAFGGIIAPELAALRNGHGITAAAFQQAQAEGAKSRAATSGPLTGRALRIAEAMPCPCGCDDKVSACSCSTAKNIRAKLAAGGYDDKPDEDVVRALNAEFCVKTK